MVAQKNEMMKNAVKELYRISSDADVRRQYELREKSWRDEQARTAYALQTGLAEGLKKGIEKGLAEGLEKGIEKGIEKGLAEGLEKGIEKGRTEGLAEREALRRKLAEAEAALERLGRQ
jgi:flagellar biosynthesis/type III secretory pathway protein FliH